METTLSPLRIASRSSWLDRWQETVADLARLKRTQPMLDAVIDEIDGRMIRVGDQWLADFASCNYLGFDLDPEIMGSIDGYVKAWERTQAGLDCWAAPSCTSRSRPTCQSCWTQRTRSPFLRSR